MGLYREAFLNIRKFPRAFWVVIAATLVNQIGNMALVFLMLYASQHLGFTLSQSASAFAVVSASMLISGIFAGNFIDYFGAAPMMIAAVFLNGAALLIFPFLHSYVFVILICSCWGFFYGIYRPASQTLVSYLTVDGLHKITFSVYRLVLNLGMSIGPAIGGYLAAHSYISIFVTNGIANILAGIILLFGLSGSLWITHRAALNHKKVFSLKWLKYDSVLRWFLLGMIPVSMVFFQHESTLPVYLNQNLGFPVSFYGWLFTINTIMIVCLELLLNIATLNWSYRLSFIIGTLFITIGFAGIYFATTMLHIILLTIMWTIGEMILYPSASSYIAEIAPPERRGSYMALFSTSSNLGMLIGPWAGAVVMQQASAANVWLVCGAWGLVSIIIFGLLIEPRNKKLNPLKKG